MRWFDLAFGALLLAATIWVVIVALIQRNPSRRTAAVKVILLGTASSCHFLATGIQLPPGVMSMAAAAQLILVGMWVLYYLRPPSQTFERYRDARLYPSILQAWVAAVGSLAFALIANGLLMLVQWIAPASDVVIGQVIVIAGAVLVGVPAVIVGIIFLCLAWDEAERGAWRRGPRQP
jgi:hypothetical protein